jgi:hypothetical protein
MRLKRSMELRRYMPRSRSSKRKKSILGKTLQVKGSAMAGSPITSPTPSPRIW